MCQSGVRKKIYLKKRSKLIIIEMEKKSSENTMEKYGE